MKYSVSVSGRTFEIEVDHNRLVRVNGQPFYVDLEQVGGLPVYSLGLEDQGYVVFVEEGQESYQVEVQGQRHPVQVRPQRTRLGPRRAACSAAAKCQVVCAPLAGRLAALPAKAGDKVEARQVVAIVESMKMQMELKASVAGVVDAVYGPAGRDVGQGEELVSIRGAKFSHSEHQRT
jgi:biotin carboxyl carrier protein